VKFLIFALVPLILSIGIIPVMFLDVNADYIEQYSLPYVLDPLTESQIKECESLYDDFGSLSDYDFYTRYQTHNFAGNCVMLYDDSLWDYDGSDRYEKLSDRSVELTQEREAELNQSRENFYIDHKSLTELQIPGSFLFKFVGCSGDQTINLNDVSVVSDKETVLLAKFAVKEREILPGVCNNLEIQIRADDPSSIKVVIESLDVEVYANFDKPITDDNMLDQPDKLQIISKSPRAQVQDGIVPNEVVCKDGYKLLLKTSNGSPACITDSNTEKLIERGWGKLA